MASSSNTGPRKVTVWVAAFAFCDDDDGGGNLPDPVKLIEPAIDWLRSKGLVPPDWQPPPWPANAENNPDGRATFVFACIAAQVPLNRELPDALDIPGVAEES